MPTTCPACGARHSEDYSRCTLCGLTPEEAAQVATAEEAPIASEPSKAPVSATPTDSADSKVFCASCGAGSAPTARFCWQCGERLGQAEVVATKPAPPPAVEAVERDDSGPVNPAGRHALLLLGGAVVLVIVLFGVTHLSGRVDPLTPPPEPPPVEMPAAVLPDDVVQQISLLEERIAGTESGDDRLELRGQLVEVLVGAGAFARAGEVQEAVAREEQTVDAWAEAGSFYLAHVLRNPGPDQPRFANRAAQAFEEALALRPDDLDIMTDLATAYRYHPEDPMRAVQLVQQVLDTNPDHGRARFNYALMLAEIGRTAQAREQLEHVVALQDGDPFVRDRAREMLETMPR